MLRKKFTGTGVSIPGHRKLETKEIESAAVKEGRAMNKTDFNLLPLMLMILLSVSACTEKRLSTEEIISRCAAAMGGIHNINNIKTIRTHRVYPDHGEHPLIFEMKRPNLSRHAGGKVVFDGKRACWIRGVDGDSKPELVDPAEWKDYELEIAYVFPAIFEYPSEFIGIESIDRREFYKLRVNLPLGATITYFIDNETSLIVKTEANFKINNTEINAYRDYFDYREVNDFYFPHGFTYGSRFGQIKGWVESYEINIPFTDDYFRIPDDVD